MPIESIVAIAQLVVAVVLSRVFLRQVDNNDRAYDDINWKGWGIGISIVFFIVGIFTHVGLNSRLADDRYLSKKRRKAYSQSFLRGMIIGIVINIALSITIFAVAYFGRVQQPSDCTPNQVFNYSTNRCREKTAEELAKEEMTRKDAGIAKKKQTGEICLSAKETWENIDKSTCVVFNPTYSRKTEYGTIFMNEKKDYTTGLTVYFPSKIYDAAMWDIVKKITDGDKPIAVWGHIEMYEGHPQITIDSVYQLSVPTLIDCDTSFGCVYSR